MKKIIIFIISFLLCIFPIFASEYDSEGYERNETNNYGVNKKWKVKDDNLNNIINTPYVDVSKKIYDYADIFNEEDENELKSLIDGFISETGLDFALVSVNLPYTNDEDYNYTYDFYDYNDFGLNNKSYGGVLFFINVYENNRIYISSVFGEAQLYVNEENNDVILDNLFDYFKGGTYKEGVISYIHQFKNYYDRGYDEDAYYIDENGSLKKNYSLPYAGGIISGALVSLLSMLGLVKKNKMVTKASNANDYLVSSSIEYLNKTDNLVSTITTHHIITSDVSSVGGSSHSGFGSSGGGHISGGRNF